MSKFFIGIIAGLAFCHFLPQAALALAIIAAIGLAMVSQEGRRKWQGRRRRARRAVPAMRQQGKVV